MAPRHCFPDLKIGQSLVSSWGASIQFSIYLRVNQQPQSRNSKALKCALAIKESRKSERRDGGRSRSRGVIERRLKDSNDEIML